MQIRLSRPEDIPAMLGIYEEARAFMRETGNPNQWADGYPAEELLRTDIERKNSYVVEEQDQIIATFAFILGDDPTYARIDDGAWLNQEPYGTIHRLASRQGTHGIAQFCFDWCKNQIRDLRADTYQDNVIMQHLLEKNGFIRCGIIYLANGSPRIAYQFSRHLVDGQLEMQRQQAQYGQQPYDAGHHVQMGYDMQLGYDGKPQKTADNGFGIASMVLGIISLITFFMVINMPLAILALVLGGVQLSRREGKGMALAGIITGEIALFLTVLMCVVIFLFSGEESVSSDYQQGYYDGYQQGYNDGYDDSFYNYYGGYGNDYGYDIYDSGENKDDTGYRGI